MRWIPRPPTFHWELIAGRRLRRRMASRVLALVSAWPCRLLGRLQPRLPGRPLLHRRARGVGIGLTLALLAAWADALLGAPPDIGDEGGPANGVARVVHYRADFPERDDVSPPTRITGLAPPKTRRMSTPEGRRCATLLAVVLLPPAKFWTIEEGFPKDTVGPLQ